MVSSLTKDTYSFLASNHFVVTSGRIGGLILALLLLVLVEKEVTRAVVRSMPLLLTFAVVVIERFRALGF